MSAADLPSRRSGARPTLGDRVRQALPVLVGLGLGYALGAALDIVAPGSVPVVLWVVGGGGLLALLVIAVVDGRRLTEDLSAVGPDAPPPRPPILRGPPLRGQPLGWVAGLVAWQAVQVSVVGVLLWVLAVGPFVLGLGLVARAGVRRRWEAARAAHPGAGVVLVGFTETGGIAWARWARSAGVRVPDRAVFASLLIGDADGLEQRVVHDGTVLHRWSWDEVELSRAPDPDGTPRAVRSAAAGRVDRAVLVLTLLGPEPVAFTRAVPAERRRSDVTTRVMQEAGATSTAAVVDAAITALRAGADGRGVGGGPR